MMLQQPDPVDLQVWSTKGEILTYKNCISLKFDFYSGTRTVKLLDSNQVRKVRDVCIHQINGMEVFL